MQSNTTCMFKDMKSAKPSSTLSSPERSPTLAPFSIGSKLARHHRISHAIILRNSFGKFDAMAGRTPSYGSRGLVTKNRVQRLDSSIPYHSCDEFQGEFSC